MKNKLTKLFCTLLLLVGASAYTPAWAEKGFWNEGTFNLQMNVDGVAQWLYGSGVNRTGVAERNLGEVSSLTFGGYWIKAWSNDNWSTSNAKLHVSVDDGTFVNWYQVDGGTTNGNHEYKVENKNIDKGLIDGKSPGEHTIKFYFALDNYRYAQNADDQKTLSGPYYVIKYSIAGPVLPDAADAVSLEASKTVVYSGEENVTLTANATNPVSGVTYHFKKGSTTLQNTESNIYTITNTALSPATTGTYTVTVEKADHNSVVSSGVTVTVNARPNYYIKGQAVESDGNWHNYHEMTFDATSGYYKYETSYIVSTDREFVLSDKSEDNSSWFKPCTWKEESIVGVTCSGSNFSYGVNAKIKLNSGYENPVTIWFDATNKKMWAVATASTPTPDFTMQANTTYTIGDAAITLEITNVTGSPTSYQWSVTSDNASNATFGSDTDASTTFSATQAGTYTVKMAATNAGGTKEKTCTITVSAAPCDPTTYTLMHTTRGEIATFTPTANANEYSLTFKLDNDIINNLYVEDDCRNRYGCSTAIQPGQSITLTTEQNTFNFQDAAQNNTWKYTFNASTKLLSCDAQSEEQKAEQTYAVTINDGDHGTVTPNGEQQVGKSGISITATPDDGYSFAGWSVTGTTANVSIANPSAASTTITASGTGAIVTATWAALIPSVTLSVDHSTRSVGQTATLTVAIENWTQLVCFEVKKDDVASDMALTDNHNNTFTTPALEVGVYRFRAHLKSACDGESKANSDWTTVTVTEDLSCDGWYFKTEMDGWHSHDFQKDPGHTDVNIGYYTLTVSTPNKYKAGVQNGGNYYKNDGTYTRENNNQWWTMNGNSGDWQFTADVAGNYVFAIDYSESTPKVRITYPTAAANAYYIYLGQTYDLPAAYTWASVNGGLPIVGNTATGKALGDYIVTRTDAGGHSEDVHVYVYQYYVKHQWGYAGGGTQEETNAAWVWRPMTLVGGTLTYTGTISNDNKGGNLCWDYTYDWTGVYQLDNDGTHNFHPGYDNDNKLGYWGNGAHKYEDGMPEATTGATTWKADWASGLSAGQVADFTFVPASPYNGTVEPTVQGGSYGKETHTGEDICMVTFGSRSYNMAGTYESTWTGANAKGSVTSNLGSTSGLKVLNGTKATFMATPLTGFEFLGWYNNADCADEHFVSANAEYSVILQSDYTIYAKFQEIPALKLKIDNGTEYAMTAGSNGAYSYLLENQSAGNHTFVVKMGSTTWNEANMNLCAALEHASYTLNSATNTVSFSVVYHGVSENVDVCVNIEEEVNSNWYAMGNGFGSQWGDDKGKEFKALYRGIEGIYYQEATMGEGTNYFRVRNSSQQYEPKSGDNENIAEGMASAKDMKPKAVGRNFMYSKQENIYVVLDTRTSGTPKMWYEKTMDYHNVNVTNKVGDAVGSTYTLTATNGLETNQYAENELYVLTITPAAGYAPVVTADGEDVEVVRNQNGTYSYSGLMSDKDQNVIIRYEALKPITIRVRNDAEDGGFAQPGCTPLLQYKVGSGEWTKLGETTPMAGFQKWFTITLPQGYVEDVTIQFCAGKTGEGAWWNGEYDWTSQKVLSSAVSEYCLSIDNYKETNYKQMRLSTANCPEFNVNLTVSGGEQVGAVATLKASAKITEDETHKVNLNYYVSYDGADYEKINDAALVGINETQAYTITRAGTYKYKVVATFNDGTSTWESEAVSKTYTVEAVTLVMTPSANYIGRNASVTLTPSITGLASNVPVTYEYATSGNCLTVNGSASPVIATASGCAVGTYTIYTTLKMNGIAIASHACNIEIGDITVSLTHTPITDVMAGTQLTLTATTTGIAGDKTYSFSVKAATEAVPVTLATAQASNSINYTVMSEDTYTFTVVVNDGVNTYKATDEVVVAAKDYYISYTTWSGYQKMNYCGNGVYTYYYVGATTYNGTNTASIGTAQDGTGAQTKTAVEYPSATGIDAIFSYNANRDELTIIPATTVMYRIKSETEHGTFYSNEVSANGKVSFYATPSATLTWQTYSKDHIDAWQDGAAVSKDGITEDNVYVADATVGGSPALNNVEVYNGTYYIYSHMTSLHESEIANVKTDSYAKHKQFQAAMTKFENLSDAEFYNHYWVEWVDVQWGNNGGYTSISRDAYATVGNTINRSISNILPSYTMTVGTNLRYGYSPKTNHFSRAFLNGAEGSFLQMFGHNIYDSSTGNTAYSSPTTALTLTDGSDWVYMAEVKCAKPAEMKLISNYTNNDATQTKYLLSADGSSATTRQLLGSTTTMEGKLKFQITYDYKTNRIVTGWIPGTDDIEGTVVVDADILFVRRDNVDVAQLTMHDENASISSLQRVMFVMEMDRDGVASGAQADYWISLPFDCRVSDIFGVEGFNDVWGLQGYNGEKRAQNGGGYNWYWLSQNDVLRRGQGYVLSFDKKIAPWKEIDSHAYLRLYFPSTEKGFTMSQSTVEPPVTYTKHEYTGGTEDQRRLHSNWRIIGPMGYTDVDMNAYHVDGDAYIEQEAPNFYYEYDPNYYCGATGNYRATDAANTHYKAFYSYLVQFAGTINWSLYTRTEQDASPMGQALAARRLSERKFTRTTMEMHLNDEYGNEVDRAFVCLRKGATEGYDQNLDLSKMTDNGGSRISTISDGSEYVANVLPIETEMVSLYVKINQTGTYSFSMVEANDKVEPVLWDTETNTMTPLNTNDLELNLDAGTYENRFYILFNDKQNTPGVVTNLENVEVETLNLPNNEEASKVMINGILYILRDGKLYDGMGRITK